MVGKGLQPGGEEYDGEKIGYHYSPPTDTDDSDSAALPHDAVQPHVPAQADVQSDNVTCLRREIERFVVTVAMYVLPVSGTNSY